MLEVPVESEQQLHLGGHPLILVFKTDQYNISFDLENDSTTTHFEQSVNLYGFRLAALVPAESFTMAIHR